MSSSPILALRQPKTSGTYRGVRISAWSPLIGLNERLIRGSEVRILPGALGVMRDRGVRSPRGNASGNESGNAIERETTSDGRGHLGEEEIGEREAS